MAFQIPPKAFHSFSLRQVVDSLYRLIRQWESSPSDSKNYLANEKAYFSYLSALKTHQNQDVLKLARDLEEFDLTTGSHRTLESLAMFLERELQKDLRESDFLISTEDTATKKQSQEPTHEVVLVLDNLRSAFNVGSLFRSAEALGAKTLYLCGYTATPENSKSAKSALGTQDWINWEYSESTIECLTNLKKDGYELLAFETSKEALPLAQFKPSARKIAIVLGNERYGLAEPVLNQVDHILEIPMFGRKNSLNVAVCGALALYSLVLAN